MRKRPNYNSTYDKALKQGHKWISDALFPASAVAIYSLSGFFTKLASRHVFLSLSYIGCLASVLVVLGTYAVLWQMLLKRMPLSKTYPYRSLGVVYGLAIAGLAFHEPITLPNLLGSLLVIIGLLVITTSK